MSAVEQQVKEFGSLLDELEKWQEQGLNQAEIALRMRRFMEYKARMKAVPLRGTFELTPLCNLNCKMCYVHLNQEQLNMQAEELLTGKQWIEIIRQAVEMGMMEATLTGGEALLHPDFDEILLFMEANHVGVNLKTNGLLLTEERVSFLKLHHLSSVQITIYGSDDEAYEQVSGRRCYAAVCDAIERVRTAGIPLEVIITPNRYGWDDLEKLVRYVDSLGVQYSVNPGLIKPLEVTGRSDDEHDLTLDQYIHLNKLMAELKGATLVPQCMEDIPTTGGTVSEKVEGMQCAAGRSVFSVTWSGRIHACRMLEKISVNGLTVPFAEAWKRINEAVKTYLFPRECVGCEFATVCPSCVIQHEYGAEPGHASPTICQRARRMAAEGFYIMKKEG